MRVKTLIDSVLPYHTQEVSPRKRNIDVLQKTFEWGKPADHNSLGYIYELITAALYGGKLTNRRYLNSTDNNGQANGKQNANNNGNGELIKPDVIYKKRNQIGESKACVLGRMCTLLDAQINRYKEIQNEERESEIYFAIYRHSIRRIKSYEGSEEELFNEVCKKTHLLVTLPLSIILELHDNSNEKLVYRYEGNGHGYPQCTCIRSHVINRFLSNPEQVIEETGLNPEEYALERRLSPENFSIEKKPVTQFPIMHIKDKDRNAWFKRVEERLYDQQHDGCSDTREETHSETETSTYGAAVPF